MQLSGFLLVVIFFDDLLSFCLFPSSDSAVFSWNLKPLSLLERPCGVGSSVDSVRIGLDGLGFLVFPKLLFSLAASESITGWLRSAKWDGSN
jgi:hypothetical protein